MNGLGLVEMQLKNSFTSCAITTSTNGSEDEKIHCFKLGQPLEAGRSVLKNETAKLNSVTINIDKDYPFATEDEEIENNEAIVDDDDDNNNEDIDEIM